MPSKGFPVHSIMAMWTKFLCCVIAWHAHSCRLSFMFQGNRLSGHSAITSSHILCYCWSTAELLYCYYHRMNHAVMHCALRWALGIFIIAVNYSQASPSELCYLINCSVIDTQSPKQCQYKLKTAAQWLVSFMHCTLMPHKSYYGDIYRLGLGSYWYVKTINITLTCARLSKPVGPRVSLSNSYSWRRMNRSSFVQWSWIVDIHLDLRVKNLLNFKPYFHHRALQRIVSLQTGCQQWRFATARDFLNVQICT